jgi:hypothetical protein
MWVITHPVLMAEDYLFIALRPGDGGFQKKFRNVPGDQGNSLPRAEGYLVDRP